VVKIIILGVLSIMLLTVSSCKEYKVLAGEMNVSVGNKQEFTIDKSKVQVDTKAGRTISVPLVIKNSTNDAIDLEIGQRVPDFIADGFQEVNVQDYNIEINKGVITQSVIGNGSYVCYINIKCIHNTKEEAWIYIKNTSGEIRKESIMRILLGGINK
jgi:hypothetical protein